MVAAERFAVLTCPLPGRLLWQYLALLRLMILWSAPQHPEWSGTEPLCWLLVFAMLDLQQRQVIEFVAQTRGSSSGMFDCRVKSCNVMIDTVGPLEE